MILTVWASPPSYTSVLDGLVPAAVCEQYWQHLLHLHCRLLFEHGHDRQRAMHAYDKAALER
jgi:hypothetical protein